MKMLGQILVLIFNGFAEADYYKWLFYSTLTLLIFSIFSKRLNHKTKFVNLIKPENTLVDNYIQFNEHEKTLIKHIIDHSRNQNYFTVAELNLHLGVKNKSIEIQKKIRTEAIIRINHKFNVNFNKDTVFIERVRSIEDRRYFNYFINEENIKTYLRG
jgi:hypothetical protein